MVLVVPKAFILNSLLDSKLSDSLFIINSFIMNVISINVKKYQKIPKIIQAYSNWLIVSTTYSICSLVIHGLMGRESSESARNSVMGNDSCGIFHASFA